MVDSVDKYKTDANKALTLTVRGYVLSLTWEAGQWEAGYYKDNYSRSVTRKGTTPADAVYSAWYALQLELGKIKHP